MKQSWLFLLSLLPVIAVASPTLALKSSVNINGTVVASTCSIVIDSNNNASRAGVIDFGIYNKSTADFNGAKNQPFTVKLYEKNSTVPGCSAFLAARQRVTFSFGDNEANQLDERGVLTKGAGDNIRIAISSTDNNVVSNHHKITSTNAVLTYPKDFASKGVFGFMATADGLDSAKTGHYHGSLSLLVTYQ